MSDFQQAYGFLLVGILVIAIVACRIGNIILDIRNERQRRRVIEAWDEYCEVMRKVTRD